MKSYFIPIIILLTLMSCRKIHKLESDYYDCQFSFVDSSTSHIKHKEYSQLLGQITGSGVVGMNMSIYHPETGMWLGSSGMADLSKQVEMMPCHISRVGSTVKMITATTVLLLQEEGKLNIDDKISNYLSGDVINKLKNADQATIRQLLQHSSGIYNYIQSLEFQTSSFNDLIREWQPEDLLKYAYNRKAYFSPGTDVRYSNTGYILLGMLIEKIEGKPFYEVFQSKIFTPLGMTNTHFASTDHVPFGTVRGYTDIYSNLQVLETTYFSGWDYHTADGGLISNPYDMNVFFRALMHGNIINNISLSEMLTWKTPNEVDPEFYPIDYGLGIFRIHTPQGIAYMHSGDAIGYFASMIYFPDDSTTIVYAVNSNYGKIDQLISSKDAVDKILNVIR